MLRQGHRVFDVMSDLHVSPRPLRDGAALDVLLLSDTPCLTGM